MSDGIYTTVKLSLVYLIMCIDDHQNDASMVYNRNSPTGTKTQNSIQHADNNEPL